MCANYLSVKLIFSVSYLWNLISLLSISSEQDSLFGIGVFGHKSSKDGTRSIRVIHRGDVDLLKILSIHTSNSQVHTLGSEKFFVNVFALKLGIKPLDGVLAFNLGLISLSNCLLIDDFALLLHCDKCLIKLNGINVIFVLGNLVLKLNLRLLLSEVNLLLSFEELVVEEDLASLLVDLSRLEVELLLLGFDFKGDLLGVDSLLLINVSSEFSLSLLCLLSDLPQLRGKVHLADLSFLTDLLTIFGLEISEERS